VKRAGAECADVCNNESKRTERCRVNGRMRSVVLDSLEVERFALLPELVLILAVVEFQLMT